jgi:hypothetical protein
MFNSWASIAFFSGVVLLVIFDYLRNRYFWTSPALYRWANELGVELLHHEYRGFSRGPFTWSPAGRTATDRVYFVCIRDLKGSEHSGFVRCRRSWFSDWKTEVRWSKPKDRVA